MGGMFTMLKVRKTLKPGDEAGWYANPKGTVAHKVDGPAEPAPAKVYVCPMHPEVRQDTPGECPKCGMKLRAGS
jgi:Cu+-exporting ATPase